MPGRTLQTTGQHFVEFDELSGILHCDLKKCPQTLHMKRLKYFVSEVI